MNNELNLRCFPLDEYSMLYTFRYIYTDKAAFKWFHSLKKKINSLLLINLSGKVHLTQQGPVPQGSFHLNSPQPQSLKLDLVRGCFCNVTSLSKTLHWPISAHLWWITDLSRLARLTMTRLQPEKLSRVVQSGLGIKNN